VTPAGQPRRRRKLTHLTQEEKILRRKLKNRVAAQNARNKKRSESEGLKSDNDDLRALVEQLREERLQQQVNQRAWMSVPTWQYLNNATQSPNKWPHLF